MALLGQASGGFTESSSALRILHVGVRNTIGQLTAHRFTQTNPPVVAGNATSASGILDGVVRGVLSGSIAFARPDNGGDNTHGGPTPAIAAAGGSTERVLGIFINNAVGNAFENQPGVASNRGPYVSAQGTYGNKLYETEDILGGGALTYAVGDQLLASRNGYLTNNAADVHANNTGLVIGILKIVPDSNSDELVYDQRI